MTLWESYGKVIADMKITNRKAVRQFKAEFKNFRTENEIEIHAKYLVSEYPKFTAEINIAHLEILTEKLLETNNTFGPARCGAKNQ